MCRWVLKYKNLGNTKTKLFTMRSNALLALMQFDMNTNKQSVKETKEVDITAGNFVLVT